MRRFDQDDAVLLAATEILPGEWRDLSDLLLRQGAPNEGLRSYLGRRSTSRDELRDFLVENLDPSRVALWENRLAALAEQRPGVTMLAVTDHGYPSNLLSVYDRPPFLFMEGVIEDRDERAIDDSRQPIGESRSTDRCGCPCAGGGQS